MEYRIQPPALQPRLFHPGMRVAVACSGGADSVALLRALLEKRSALGLVLSVAHMNHGIRSAEADADQIFVEALTDRFDLQFHTRRVNTPALAEAKHQGLEEAARIVRYAWFRELLAGGHADAVVTAHTLDDQAETVLQRLIRGAWTEGLSGIFPVLELGPKPGLILRPFLSATRCEIEAWLRQIGQPWCEDATNRDTAYTRNRIRHHLLPALVEYNPQIQKQLAHLAAVARDEEAYWQAELARMLPALLLPGKPVRGGGRATSTLPGDRSLAIEIERLRGLHPALRRRVLRAAAERLGISIGFEGTGRLLELCGVAVSREEKSVGAGRKLQLERGLCAERTPREVRLFLAQPESTETENGIRPRPEYKLPIPGAVDAPAFGLRLEAAVGNKSPTPLPDARLRASLAGDRVVLRHSRSRLKIKEALRRARLPVAAISPVLEWQGEIVWMPGVAVESGVAQAAVLTITSAPLG